MRLRLYLLDFKCWKSCIFTGSNYYVTNGRKGQAKGYINPPSNPDKRDSFEISEYHSHIKIRIYDTRRTEVTHSWTTHWAPAALWYKHPGTCTKKPRTKPLDPGDGPSCVVDFRNPGVRTPECGRSRVRCFWVLWQGSALFEIFLSQFSR